jgi:hypothetical protein
MSTPKPKADVYQDPDAPIVLADIINRRYAMPVGTGSNPARYAELFGAREVPISFIEPDPVTFRSDYYYNSRHNRLYKRLRTEPKPVWKVIS